MFGHYALSDYGSAPAYAEAEPIGKVVYDGFGNPVGFSPFDIIRNIPIVGGLVSNLLPGGGAQPAPPPPPFIPPPLPPMPYAPGFPPGAPQFPSPFPFPGRLPTPWPLGWSRRPLPYTGLGPRRLYMRCAVWPGPQGLVPEYAAQMMPQQQAQAWQQWQPQPPPGAPGAPGFPGAGSHRRRRFRRR